MTNQDDILQHYKYKGRRKSKNVMREYIGGANTVRTPGATALEKEEKAKIRKDLRSIRREDRELMNRKFHEVKKALSSNNHSVTRTNKILNAIEAFREAKMYRDGKVHTDGNEALQEHLKNLTESKKANDRSRQQHGEVQVRSYRRNGKIVRGYKRARRSSKKR